MRIQHALDQDFDIAATGLAGPESRGDHAGIVEYEQVPGLEQIEQVGEAAVFQLATAAVETKQPAGSPFSERIARNQVLWHVVLKAALPEILTGMRIAIAFGWTTLVAAEMVAAKAGLGVMVLNAARFLATDIVFLGIVVIGLIAFFFDVLMRQVEKVLVPWKGKA